METILKQIFGEKTYLKLSNDGQKTSYPIVKEEIGFCIEQKKSKYRNKKSNPVAKQGQIQGVQFVTWKCIGQNTVGTNAHLMQRL